MQIIILQPERFVFHGKKLCVMLYEDEQPVVYDSKGDYYVVKDYKYATEDEIITKLVLDYNLRQLAYENGIVDVIHDTFNDYLDYVVTHD